MVSGETTAYVPQVIEPKWQAIWEERRQYAASERSDKQKFYLLEMLPYPSGDLHVGHARNYTLGDVVARFQRMRGYNVLHPMGWDAFGLPAEVAAIARGLHPREWTDANIANMRSQIRKLGTSYDWSREINSSAPEYYRWTQWLFLLMHRKGLAYKAQAWLNWCPLEQTILANEQAEGGVCWRCGSVVERRLLNQWFLKITDYADKLLEGLDALDEWPERVKTMQRNWIGRSAGVACSFPVEGLDANIEVFTTRIDTIFGVTYLALAPEHPLVERLVDGSAQAAPVRAFVSALKDKSELERASLRKEGVFTGRLARNPFGGQPVPIWITNYVLVEYGTGAVMGVPAHDERDFEFARDAALPMKPVIVPASGDANTSPAPVSRKGLPETAFCDDGILTNSGAFSGMSSAQAREAMRSKLEQLGAGRSSVKYKLRDWLVSRERYWGAPIPMVLCPNDGYVPVPEEQLPVLLPDQAPISGTQGSPLAHVPEFMHTTCPKCGGPATREAETLDTFMCSSWYYLRYLSPRDDGVPWDLREAERWAPVDHYIGGIEHAVLHLMYARFFYKVLNEERLVPGDEPFMRLFNQGMVLGENHEKMSKSRGNTIAIDDAVATYGADALRLFEMFAGPPGSDFPWSTTGISGATRTLKRIWRLVLAHALDLAAGSSTVRANGKRLSAPEAALRHSVHTKIKKIGEEIAGRMHLNTCVADLMTLLNDIEAFVAASPQEPPDAAAAGASSPVLEEALETLLLLLAPFAPHITEELWQRTGHSRSIHEERWPAYDERWLKQDLVSIVIQVNGIRRGAIEMPHAADEESIFVAAATVPTVKAQLQGKQVRKRVYVKDRLLNIVVS
ncbi:MAG: leucine--tRNA ligase [Candidatus Eremiobacter antarcticus]|nr:leucine--tRNA ligase [Candidatus Eremiobacteraeota bacterium]MBC5806976.1 leucine--tRNA ligase [Candidatus Eremiobacteraeota bacterium]PZR62906.1 MAG: leucine--tRNA ligase [Candidatus Eremiobacter sp. RRmetagenome_bin22]